MVSWIQLLNDKNTAHTRMLYYAIKHTFTVRDKHVHDYVYSNMYSIDYVTTLTLESHIHTVAL